MSTAMQLRILNHARVKIEEGQTLAQALDDIAAADHRRRIQTLCAGLKAKSPIPAADSLKLVDAIIKELKGRP
jgi:diphthamide synthase (EF-2-diphthine--ammonia ligase)